ncbi:MAG: MFS transporter [Bacillota bacterium]
MVNWKRNLVFASIGVFVAAIGFNFTTPFLPQYLNMIGLTEDLSAWSGVMIAVNSLTYAIMAPVWGSLADRHGKRPMLVRSGFGIALTYVLMGYSRTPLQYFLLRAANGLLAGFITSSIMLVASNTPEKEMGFALGIIQTAIAVGNIMGPFFGGFCAKWLGIRSTMFFGAAILTIASSLAVFGTRERVVAQDKRTSVVDDLRYVLGDRTLLSVIMALLIVQVALTVIQPALPLFVGSLVPPQDVEVMTGIIFSIIGLSTAIGAPLLSRLKGINYQRTFIQGLGAAAVLSVVQGFSRQVYLLGFERFVFGFANAAITVGGNVLIAQNSVQEMRGRAFGALNGISSLGAVVGPLIGGYLGDHLGLSSPFFGGGLFFAAAALVVVYGAGSQLRVRRPQQS